MGLFGPYVYKSKKGERYWLHVKEQGKRRLYYFSKNPANGLGAVPAGYEVIENPKTGLPMLRKKRGGGLFGALVGAGKKQPKEKKAT